MDLRMRWVLTLIAAAIIVGSRIALGYLERPENPNTPPPRRRKNRVYSPFSGADWMMILGLISLFGSAFSATFEEP